MILGSGEKAALLGGALLAAGLVTAVLLYVWPKQPVKESATPEPDASSTAPEVPRPAASPGAAPLRPERGSELRKEVRRLREELERKDQEIAVLRKRLREAGVTPDGTAPNEGVLAEEALRLLSECNRETPVRDITAIRNRLVTYGEKAIPAVVRRLQSKEDVVFSDLWVYDIQERRFTTSPTLRSLLIDSLYRMGVEGQRALVELLETIDDALEICQIIGLLADVESIPQVAEARLAAARRYVDLPPPQRESYVLEVVLDALLEQEPAEAAASLEKLVRREAGQDDAVRLVLARFPALSPEVAVETLVGLASDPALGERAVMAAEQLAGLPGPETSTALAGLLDAAAPGLRRAVYRSLDDPVDRGLDEVEKTGRRTSYGLAAQSELARVEADLAARLALVRARMELEKSGSTRGALEEAERSLGRLADRAAALRKTIEGE